MWPQMVRCTGTHCRRDCLRWLSSMIRIPHLERTANRHQPLSHSLMEPPSAPPPTPGPKYNASLPKWTDVFVFRARCEGSATRDLHLACLSFDTVTFEFE